MRQSEIYFGTQVIVFSRLRIIDVVVQTVLMKIFGRKFLTLNSKTVRREILDFRMEQEITLCCSILELKLTCKSVFTLTPRVSR